MSSILSSPSVVGTIITLVVGVVLSLIGLVYRRMKRRIDEHDSTIAEIEERTSTLFNWAFGAEHNDADRGISQDVEEGFNEISDRLEELEAKQDEHHNELTTKLDRLVRELEREDAVDIDREDLE